MKRWSTFAVGMCCLMAVVLAGSAFGQIDPITPYILPVDLDSLQAEVGSKGGQMLGLVWPLGIAFGVAWMIYFKIKKSIA